MNMQTRKEIIELLEGQEILSLHFENVVGIYKGKIWDSGEIVGSLKGKNVQILWDEYCEQEGTHKEIREMIKEKDEQTQELKGGLRK